MTDLKESPIFSRLHDLVKWLAQATRKFPRDQRPLFARRVLDQAFALEDALVAAALDRAALASHLLQADLALGGLRRTLLLCFELDFLCQGQFRHASGLTAEVGRLLGGWRRRPGAEGGPAREARGLEGRASALCALPGSPGRPGPGRAISRAGLGAAAASRRRPLPAISIAPERRERPLPETRSCRSCRRRGSCSARPCRPGPATGSRRTRVATQSRPPGNLPHTQNGEARSQHPEARITHESWERPLPETR
jgi:hypothetical protein